MSEEKKIPNRSNWNFGYTLECTSEKGILKKEWLINLFIRRMFIITSRLFKYTNLPETIKEKDLEFQLQMCGFAFFTKVNDKYYTFVGGLGGERNSYYLPTIITIANPYLKFNKSCKFENDEDGILILNDNTYDGLLPLNRYYAVLLAENVISLQVALINSRAPSIISVKGDEEYASALNYIESILKGDIGIISTTQLLSGIDTKAFANGMLDLNQYTETIQYIKASWFNELGLNVNYNMKREYLNESETTFNIDAIVPSIDEMLKERQNAIEKINKKYGLNISVELDSAWAKQEEKSNMELESMENEVGDNNEKVSSDNGQDTSDNEEDN